MEAWKTHVSSATPHSRSATPTFIAAERVKHGLMRYARAVSSQDWGRRLPACTAALCSAEPWEWPTARLTVERMSNVQTDATAVAAANRFSVLQSRCFAAIPVGSMPTKSGAAMVAQANAIVNRARYAGRSSLAIPTRCTALNPAEAGKMCAAIRPSLTLAIGLIRSIEPNAGAVDRKRRPKRNCGRLKPMVALAAPAAVKLAWCFSPSTISTAAAMNTAAPLAGAGCPCGCISRATRLVIRCSVSTATTRSGTAGCARIRE